jgi:hypothetical protein
MAQAAYVYTYTGNNFDVIQDDVFGTYPGTYDRTISVSANFTLSSLIPADSTFADFLALVTEWTVFDGRKQLTTANSTLVRFKSRNRRRWHCLNGRPWETHPESAPQTRCGAGNRLKGGRSPLLYLRARRLTASSSK